MATEFKKINKFTSVSSVGENDNLLLFDDNGSCKKIGYNNLIAPKATTASALLPSAKTFSGTTMADLKTHLMSLINSIDNFAMPTFRLSIPYEAFKHFNEDDYVIPTSNRYNVNWTVLAHNSASSFDYIQLLGVTTTSGFPIYIINISRSTDNTTWNVRKLQTVEP